MTQTAGRPLRFIAMVLLCWTLGRIAATTPWPGSLDISGPTALAAETYPASRLRATISLVTATPRTRSARFPIVPAGQDRPVAIARTRPQPAPAIMREPIATYADASNTTDSMAPYPTGSAIAMPHILPVDDPDHTGRQSRWSLDAWLLWRDGGARAALSDTGQLGASQAGARLQYDLTPFSSARLAAYTRLTSALASPAAPEAALGLAWQPDRTLPVTLAVERRAALGHGARNAFAVIAATGFGPVDAPLGLRSEGYAQAGFVGLRQRDAFVDGKLSLLRPVIRDRLGAGISLSGGAQPHLNRLDIGPEVQARLSIGRSYSRLSAEWRQRIAGRARPGSGLAVTLSAGF